MSFLQVIKSSFEDLKSLPQRQDYHPEKWVFDHEAYVWFDIWKNFEGREKKELLYASCFHDIGKRDVTKRKDGDGYIISYGHAQKSLYYWDSVSDILCENSDVRPEVVRWIIKEHMNIKFLDRMNKGTTEKKRGEASKLGENVWEMGKKFSKFDDMSRFFEKYNLDYIKPIQPPEEVNVIDKHREALGRFENFLENEIYLKIKENKSKNKDNELFIVRGVPGSGKTTFGKLISGSSGKVLETDQFFVSEGEYNFDPSKLSEAHNWCRKKVRKEMEKETSPLVLSNTSTQVWEFLEFYKLAFDYNYRVHSLVKENRHGKKSTHNISEDQIQKMKNRFQIQL